MELNGPFSVIPWIFIICILFIFFIQYQIKSVNIITSPITFQHGIPPIIIQTWKTSIIPNKYKYFVNQLKKQNPQFEYKFFTDADIVSFLQNNYPEYYKTYQRLPVNIQKIDFFRYIAVYHYGGFYFDLDMEPMKPLDNDILQYDSVFPVDYILTQKECNQYRFVKFCKKNMRFLAGQYAFGAKAHNPFVKLLIDTIHQNIDNTVNSYYNKTNQEIYVYQTTGPDFVTDLYEKYNHKNSVHILEYKGKQQYFGKYAVHRHFGTWK